MKSKYWAILLALILAGSMGLSVLFMAPREAAGCAVVTSQGKVSRIVNLQLNQEFLVRSADGINTVTVKDGKIAVTEANCPDHYCMDRGFCNGGSPIVCLPNSLVIEFTGEQEIDGLIG